MPYCHAGEKKRGCSATASHVSQSWSEIAADLTSPRAAPAFYLRAQRRLSHVTIVGAGNFRGGRKGTISVRLETASPTLRQAWCPENQAVQLKGLITEFRCSLSICTERMEKW